MEKTRLVNCSQRELNAIVRGLHLMSEYMYDEGHPSKGFLAGTYSVCLLTRFDSKNQTLELDSVSQELVRDALSANMRAIYDSSCPFGRTKRIREAQEMRNKILKEWNL